MEEWLLTLIGLMAVALAPKVYDDLRALVLRAFKKERKTLRETNDRNGKE